MKPSRKLALLALLLIPVGVACSVPRFSAVPRVAWMDIDGDIAVSDRRGTASASSDADDLGLDTEVVFMPRVDLDWSPLHVSVNGFSADYSGDGEATARISFGDLTIARGAGVETDAQLDYAVGTVVFDVLPLPEVEVGIGVGVGYLAYDLTFRSKDAPVKIDLDDSTPFGYLAARVAAEIGPVRLLGTVGGVSLDLGDDDVEYLEFDVSAGLRVFGDVGLLEGHVVAGYRYLDLDYTWKASEGRLDANVTLLGPYVGFDLSF